MKRFKGIQYNTQRNLIKGGYNMIFFTENHDWYSGFTVPYKLPLKKWKAAIYAAVEVISKKQKELGNEI